MAKFASDIDKVVEFGENFDEMAKTRSLCDYFAITFTLVFGEDISVFVHFLEVFFTFVENSCKWGKNLEKLSNIWQIFKHYKRFRK